MKFLIFLASAVSVVDAAVCNADNCARAVTGTARGLIAQSSAKKDCESFFKTTISPATVTETAVVSVFPFSTTITSTTGTVSEFVTVYPETTTLFVTTNTATETTTVETATATSVTETTTTIETTITVAPPIKRTLVERATTDNVILPTSVPAYASPCSGTVRYSSACSCFGVTRTTITLPTPTTTITNTVTGSSTFFTDIIVTSVQTVSLTSTITSLTDYTTTLPSTLTTTTTSTLTVPLTSTATVIGTPCGSTTCTSSQRCQDSVCVTDECFKVTNGCNPSPNCVPNYANVCNCYETPVGNRCVSGGSCSGPYCYKNADCTAGRTCVLKSCCTTQTPQGVRGVCLTTKTCPNGAATRRMFARREVRLDD